VPPLRDLTTFFTPSCPLDLPSVGLSTLGACRAHAFESPVANLRASFSVSAVTFGPGAGLASKTQLIMPALVIVTLLGWPLPEFFLCVSVLVRLLAIWLQKFLKSRLRVTFTSLPSRDGRLLPPLMLVTLGLAVWPAPGAYYSSRRGCSSGEAPHGPLLWSGLQNKGWWARKWGRLVGYHRSELLLVFIQVVCNSLGAPHPRLAIDG
jgi:hypothetical protein